MASGHRGELLEAALSTEVAAQRAVGAHEALVARALARLGPVGAARVAVPALDGRRRHARLGPSHLGLCGGACGAESRQVPAQLLLLLCGRLRVRRDGPRLRRVPRPLCGRGLPASK